VHRDNDLAAVWVSLFLMAATLEEENQTVTTKNRENVAGVSKGEVLAHGRATSSSLASLPNSKADRGRVTLSIAEFKKESGPRLASGFIVSPTRCEILSRSTLLFVFPFGVIFGQLLCDWESRHRATTCRDGLERCGFRFAFFEIQGAQTREQCVHPNQGEGI
jgi:hypothetical protein